MNKLIAVVLAFAPLTHTALAEGPPERWVALSMLSNVGEETNPDVKQALRDADVQIARVTDEFKTKVCGDRAAYESDPVALANALQRRADAINKIYVEELAKLDAKLLASGAKAEIDAKVADANFRLKTVDTVDEHIQRVREGVVPITPLLQGVCDQAKFGNADRGA